MRKSKHRLGIIIVIYLGILLLSCQNELKFESAKWKNGGGENITLNIRKNMVNDLIESRILLNRNEDEISKLIGFPEKLTNRNTDYKQYYPVQEKYGWNIDPEEMTFLEIVFDKEGMSESIKLIGTK